MNTAQRIQPRNKRAPRHQADPLAIFRVLGRAAPFTEAEQVQLNLPVRLAYDAMLKGLAVEGDFHTLAAAINIAMVCSESIDPLVEQSCIAGLDAMQRLYERHQRTGSWGFDGPAIHEVEQSVEIYEQLTALLTGGQLKSAMQTCIQRMRDGQYIGAIQ
jgi:hypothetical protein